MRSRLGARFGVVLATLATVVAAAVVVTARSQQANAVSGTQFKAGNIISNKDFYDFTAMTIAQVQSFLNAEVPDCQSGYTCLPQYTTKTTSQPAKAGLCKAYTGQPKETAAQVIVHVAHACGINPQVLIVLLQKEQGLVTSTAPSSRAYAYATGANCPDTTGCDSASSGFFTQVYLAAYQFQYYKAHPDYYQYLAGATNNILYSPRKGCGSSPVYIQNEATASLYIYTPYQPNAAALANLYGTGDSCSSYGNRNFWVYFTTWFGPGTPDPTPPGSESPYGPGGLLVRDGSTMYDWTNTANTSAPYLPTVRTQLAGTWQGYDRIVAGDVDDDGQPDLIARKPDGTLWLFDNSGNATAPYGSPVQIGSGWQAYNTIAAADIDGDGFADVIARDASGQLYLYRNSQKATAPYPTGAPIGSGFGAYATLLLGDVNGDGYADLIAIKPDGTQWLFVNTQKAAAPFGSPVQLAGSSWDIYNPIVLVDIDGDGLVDLVARSSNGDLWLYVNTGNAAKPFTGGRTDIGTGWGTYDLFVGAQVPFPAGACQPQTAAPFTDVPLYSAFCGSIAWLKTRQVSSGYADGGFHADASLTRQAMAAFLYRLSSGGQDAPACTAAPFPDVATASTFCGAIAWLKAQHVSAGYADGGFHPVTPMSRQAMAAFLFRLDNPGATQPTCTARPFPDVATTSTFCGAIAWLKTQQASAGYADGGFHPATAMSRQAMAAFLYRLNTTASPAVRNP